MHHPRLHTCDDAVSRRTVTCCYLIPYSRGGGAAGRAERSGFAEGRGPGGVCEGGEGGTNRCARIHAVASRPHCRLTLTAPGDAARHGEWISVFVIISPRSVHMADVDSTAQ